MSLTVITQTLSGGSTYTVPAGQLLIAHFVAGSGSGAAIGGVYIGGGAGDTGKQSFVAQAGDVITNLSGAQTFNGVLVPIGTAGAISVNVAPGSPYTVPAAKMYVARVTANSVGSYALNGQTMGSGHFIAQAGDVISATAGMSFNAMTAPN